MPVCLIMVLCRDICQLKSLSFLDFCLWINKLTSGNISHFNKQTGCVQYVLDSVLYIRDVIDSRDVTSLTLGCS